KFQYPWMQLGWSLVNDNEALTAPSKFGDSFNEKAGRLSNSQPGQILLLPAIEQHRGSNHRPFMLLDEAMRDD
ncbi:hypothetical protein D9C01_13205, partial [Corynebacterium diphtheriae]